MNNKLLREYVREVIASSPPSKSSDSKIISEYFDDYGVSPWVNAGDNMAMGTYGASLGTIFIKPFVDAFKVVGAEIGKTGVRFATLARTALEAALSVLVPRFEADYDRVFAQQTQAIDKIKEKYAAAYKSVNEAWDHPDIALFSFMYDPTTWITYKAITTKPEAVLAVYDTLAAGQRTMGLFLRDIRNRIYGGDQYSMPRVNDREPAVGQAHESRLREAPIAQTKRKKTPGEMVADALTSPEFIKMVKESSVTKEMKADAAKLSQGTAGALNAAMSPILAAKSVDDLAHASGGAWHPPPGSDELPPDEKKKLDDELTSRVKASMATYYGARTAGLIGTLEGMGVSDESPYVRSLRNMMTKLAPIAKAKPGADG